MARFYIFFSAVKESSVPQPHCSEGLLHFFDVSAFIVLALLRLLPVAKNYYNWEMKYVICRISLAKIKI